MKYLYIVFLITLLSAKTVPDSIQNQQGIESRGDSIISWIKFSKNKKLSYLKRKSFLDRSFSAAINVNKDSIRNVYLSKIAYHYFKLGDSLAFRNANSLTIALSIKLKDSARLANNYWDLAEFYSRYEVNDSAYYNYSKSQKLFESLDNQYYEGLVLLNMAIIQSELRDYTGSEVTTIKALEQLKPFKNDSQLYRCYNNLAVVFNGLEDYNKALFYHKKALDYQVKIKSKNNLKVNTLNNIGVVYQRINQHAKAINNYNEALKTDSLKQKDTKLYAKLIDNLAYSKYKLKDTVRVFALFHEALQLRDSVNDIPGKTINLLHLAEYHATYNDSIKALQLANKAKYLAEQSKNYRDLLASLTLLSKLDKKNSQQYSQRYIAINDSLVKEERAIRDKIARIRFHTDEFIQENLVLEEEKEVLTKQRKRILIIGSIILLLGVLLYIIRDQRVKNVRLRLEKEQQQANEEIYNLMLSQQYELDESKRNEKKRISEELHDGVLGNLYGIKLNLAVLNPHNNPDAILKREAFIEGLSKVIDEIRNVSHELHVKAIDADVGYVQLIEDLLSQKSKTNGYNYQLLSDNDTNWQLIPGDIKMNIYRILQEAIQNINKYAQANNVKVGLKSDGDFINLTINDDGIGFNTSTKKDGIGIKNIKSRIERLNGNVKFKSVPKKGTSILIKIPYDSI